MSSTVHGTFNFHVDDDSTDRIGIRTVVLGKRWVASRWPMALEELDAEEPAPPLVPGGLLLVGRQRRHVPGGLRTQWSYEGVDGDGRSVTFKDRAHSLDYDFQGGFSTVSIMQSNRWAALKAQFGGEVLDGQVIWPDTTPDTRPATGLPGPNTKEGEPNPMFGREDFLRLEGTYSFRCVAFSLAGAEVGVSQIHTSGDLPGVAPHYENRNWLKAPIVYRRRGTVFEIVEIYWLSGEGGWPEPIYGTLKGNGSKLVTLSTGSLQASSGL